MALVQPAPDRTSIVVDGCALSYRRAGRGDPLVFFHGEDGLREWEPWLSRFAERYDVIAPDHPAFGYSDWPAWLDDVHDLAYFYLDVFEALGLPAVHLIGHSLGGWIGCELAVRDRRALRSLTLVASGGVRLRGVPKLDRFIIPSEEVVRAGFTDRARAEAVLATPRTPDDLERELRNQFAVARLQWQPRHDLRLPKWMHRIAPPTQIVWGAQDRIVPPAYADEFARLIPGARVATIPRCGHFPQLEQPQAFLAVLDAFLSEVRPG